MANLPNDFELIELDFTATPGVLSLSDLNMLRTDIKPTYDRGLVITTVDSAQDVVVLPTFAGDMIRTNRYIWRRISYDQKSARLYFYIPNINVDPYTDKWRQITADPSENAITPIQLDATVSGFGTYLDSVTGLNIVLSLDTITILRTIATSILPLGTVVYLQGHSVVGDDGGGWFILKSTTGELDNNGSIIKSTATTGLERWYRIVPEGAKCRAEWFGAKGDGINGNGTDDILAIVACMQFYNRVDLYAKTYIIGAYTSGGAAVNTGIHMYAGSILSGMGKDRTIVRLKNNAQGVSYNKADLSTGFYMVASIYNSSYDNMLIEGLTIDANYDGQTNPPTIKAIALWGANNIVREVKATNCGTGIPNNECFVIYLKLPGTATNRAGSKIINCDYTGIGANAAFFQSTTPGEVSIFLVGSEPAGNDRTVVQECPEISGCRIFNVHTDATQKSYIHCINIAGTNNAIIRDNLIQDCDGVGIYFQADHNFNFLITNNNFDSVHLGIDFNITSDIAPGFADFEGWMKNGVISNNNFNIKTDSTGPLTAIPCGIYLFSACDANYKLKNAAGNYYTPLENIVIKDNVIKWDSSITGLDYILIAGVKTYPIGINFLLTGTYVYNNIVIENNIIEVYGNYVDGTTKYLGIPYENAMIFYPSYAYKNTRLKFLNNRNYLGDKLKTKLLSGSVTFESWLNDDWYNFSSSAVLNDFPVNLTQLYYNETTGRIFLPAKLKTVVASGSLVPGKTYVVKQTDTAGHVDYNGTINITDGQTFVAVVGVLTYVAANAEACEHYSYCWKELNEKTLITITVPAGTSDYVMSLDKSVIPYNGIIKIAFDSTAAVKKLALPDPAYFTGEMFTLVTTCAAANQTVTLYCESVSSSTQKLVSSASAITVTNLQLSAGNATPPTVASVKIYSDGTYWFIK